MWDQPDFNFEKGCTDSCVHTDIWAMHAVDAAWSCLLLKWCHFDFLCQVPQSLWYSISWWGENRCPTVYSWGAGKPDAGTRDMAVSVAARPGLPCLAGLGGTPDRPVLQASLGSPVYTRQKVPRWLIQQSHASLTSAINRASLWLLAKYFHNVCLHKL